MEAEYSACDVGRPTLTRVQPVGTLLAVGACAVMAAGGCTVIDRENADGSRERSLSLLAPITIVSLSPDAAKSIRVMGLGVGITTGSYNFGLFRMSETLLDP